MSLRRNSLTTAHKDTMVTANANATSEVVHSPPSRHVQIATDYEAQRRLQALDDCTDSSCDNVPQLAYSSLYSKTTTRRPTVFNCVVDVDELGAWSTHPACSGSVTADQQQQPLSHSVKTNRPRLIAEVTTAHSSSFSVMIIYIYRKRRH